MDAPLLPIVLGLLVPVAIGVGTAARITEDKTFYVALWMFLTPAMMPFLLVPVVVCLSRLGQDVEWMWYLVVVVYPVGFVAAEVTGFLVLPGALLGPLVLFGVGYHATRGMIQSCDRAPRDRESTSGD